MRAGADYGVGMDQAKPDKPVDIRTAYELWCAVAVLGVFASIALVFVTLGERASFTEDLRRRLEEMDPKGAESIDLALAFNVGVAIACLIGIAVAAAVYVLARKMRAGKGWARLVLTGATAFVVVSVISSFAGSGRSGAAPMALDIIMILQAVLAVGATVLSHRRDASVYLAKRPKV